MNKYTATLYVTMNGWIKLTCQKVQKPPGVIPYTKRSFKTNVLAKVAVRHEQPITFNTVY
jgi:hypothetical protein